MSVGTTPTSTTQSTGGSVSPTGSAAKTLLSLLTSLVRLSITLVREPTGFSTVLSSDVNSKLNECILRYDLLLMLSLEAWTSERACAGSRGLAVSSSIRLRFLFTKITVNTMHRSVPKRVARPTINRTSGEVSETDENAAQNPTQRSLTKFYRFSPQEVSFYTMKPR